MEKIKVGAVVVAAVATLFAAPVTKVLQNGTDGYQGCEDTYICHQGYDYLEKDDDALNHEGDNQLKMKMCTT